MHHLTILNRPQLDRYPYSECVHFMDKTIFFNQKYSLPHWDPFVDTDRDCNIFILGRPAIDRDCWTRFDNQPAFITRQIYQNFVKLPLNKFCLSINGAFTLLIIDRRNYTLTIVRDRFGVFPIYSSAKHDLEHIQISTHPDILASHTESKELDKTSVAEFLACGSISHPFTFFRNISAIPPGAYLTLDYRDQEITEASYFSLERPSGGNSEELKDDLQNALLASIQRRTHSHYGKTGVLLSGGGDSRPIAVNSVTSPTAFTSFSRENHELEITKEITRRLGIRHELIQRTKNSNVKGLIDSPYYTSGMSTGGGGTLMDLLRSDAIMQMDNILSGDYADWLLKDIAFNTMPITIFGKKLPLKKFSDFSFHFYGGSVPIPVLQNRIADRRNSIFPLSKRQQSNALQFRRIVPLSNEYTSSTRLFFQRTLPWESPFIDNDVINCVLRIPPDLKLNGRLYDQALKILCRPIIDIPHASKGTRLGTNQYVTAFWMTLAMLEKKFGRDSQTHQATWDKPSAIMYSDSALHKLFYSANPSSQKYITDIVGLDIFSLTLDQIFNIDYHLFFNAISFCAWLETNDISV